MTNTPTTVKESEEEAGTVIRSYAEYNAKDFSFDPMKDLNLPASYDEVLVRFKHLQGDREPEALN